MAVFDNINTTYQGTLAPEIPQFYTRTLLHDVEPMLVYQRDMQHKTLPLNNGRSVQFRKFNVFGPITTPLKEGVTPEGQLLSVTEFFCVVKPYGGFVPFTDELNTITIDDIHRETATMLARQARETLDALCADAANSGTNVIYADAGGGVNTSRADIVEGTDILTGAHIKRAVRLLEKNNAQRFPDGFYHAIVDPETKFDLTADSMWVDIAKYQDKSRIDRYELGTMYGVKFFMTTQTKVFDADEYLYKDGSSAAVTELALNGGAYNVADGYGYVTVAKTTPYATGTDADYAYLLRRLVGRMLAIYDASETASMNCLVDNVALDGTNIKLRLRYLDTAADWAYASGDKITVTGGGASDCDVHSTVIYGQDYAGTVTLGGDGGNIQSIIKPCGSSGAEDPLDQRGTAAWKVKGFCATILQDGYVVRVEHSVSAS